MLVKFVRKMFVFNYILQMLVQNALRLYTFAWVNLVEVRS